MLRSWGGGAAFTAASDMSSTLQAARQISSRVRRCSLLPAVATTQRHGKHDNQGNKCCATYSTLSNTRGSSAACGRTLRLKSTASKHGYHSQFFQSMSSRSTVAHVPARPSSGEGGTAGSYRRAAFVGPVRAFGGQSVVPWELALFLVEEVRRTDCNALKCRPEVIHTPSFDPGCRSTIETQFEFVTTLYRVAQAARHNDPPRREC